MGNNKYGLIIKRLRKNNNMTQKELADRLNVTSNCISGWEVGRNEPNMDMVQKMCDIFGVTLNEMVGKESRVDYYIEDSVSEIAEFLHKNPEYSVLFDASRKVSKDDIERVRQMIELFINR